LTSKIREDDWDRLFDPNTPRRGGIRSALFRALLWIGLLVAIYFGVNFLIEQVNIRQEQIAAQQATAQVLAKTAEATAAAATATIAARQTAVAGGGVSPATPVASPITAYSLVITGGNMRNAPEVVDGNVLGLIWPGDQLAVFEQRQIADQVWYRVQVVAPATPRGGEGVATGATGWVAGVLTSPLTPVPGQ
jgi:hypothetical protein